MAWYERFFDGESARSRSSEAKADEEVAFLTSVCKAS